MRIKKFVDNDMIRLMHRVKEELGDEAVIVSTSQTADGRSELVAAVETDDVEFSDKDEPQIYAASYSDAVIRERLDFHETGALAQAKLLSLCRRKAIEANLKDDAEILTSVLSDLFTTYDILDKIHPIKVFVGLQGSGKTTALVKTAALAHFKGLSAAIVSMDTVRAGANAQLRAFAGILGVEFNPLTHAKELLQTIRQASATNDLVLVDTPGLNPFSADDNERLKELVAESGGETILTLDAGYNAYDAGETGFLFAQAGATCLLPTKLDLCRRMGGLLSAAVEGGFRLGWASVSSNITNGLTSLDMPSLARALLA